MTTFQISVVVLALVALPCLGLLLHFVRTIQNDVAGLRSELIAAINQREASYRATIGRNMLHTGPNHLRFGWMEFFVIWEWCDGNWVHRSDLLPAGADPGAPPTHPGAFPGHVIKTWICRAR